MYNKNYFNLIIFICTCNT